MIYKIYLLLLLLIFTNSAFSQQGDSDSFMIAFGSCNKVNEPNPFWDQIIELQPDLFIWGGDNIYADTDNMKKMEAMYAEQNNNPAYAEVKQDIPIVATWDDHDYGKNDAGRYWHKKEESQQLFLNFLDVPKNDPRRTQEGVYYTETFRKNDKTIKIIALDTRYFRDSLQASPDPKKRYTPARDSSISLLGAAQWKWVEEELTTSEAEFNIIVSSIQLLSGEHGFETWANFPLEVEKFINLLKENASKRVIVLSGDRHISEFSRRKISGLENPLVDFTSSGLTHAYTQYDGEPNKYRVGEVVAERSFGTVQINLESHQVVFRILGAEGHELEKLVQDY